MSVRSLLLAAASASAMPHNGSAWTTATSPANYPWKSVAYGNGVFVAIQNGGVDNTVMTSPNGISWTTRTGAGTASNVLSAITFGGGLFVAVGSSRCMSSPDGITWTAQSLGSGIFGAIAYGAGVYAALATAAGQQLVRTSPDAVTWTNRTLPTTATWTGIAFGNGVFSAVASGTIAATSPDGITTWTQRSKPSTGVAMGSSAFGAGLFVQVPSASSNAALSSPDGITWTARTLANTAAYTSIDAGLGFVAADNAIGTRSDDGITWVNSPVPTGAWQDICFGGGKFVAVGTNIIAVTTQ